MSDEPDPVGFARADANGPFFFTCEHAGHRLPQNLGTLGLDPIDRKRHIAWDIGALDVSEILSEAFASPLIFQRYSRLVVDCNRQPHAPDAIVTRSEETDIPGNMDLSVAHRNQRIDQIFHPYQQATLDHIDRRKGLGLPPIHVSVHSFTPVFKGERRSWDIGILYDRHTDLAKQLLSFLSANSSWILGDNDPYGINREHDFAIPVLGDDCGLINVELEIRQDLIDTPNGAKQVADVLVNAFRAIASASP